MICLGPALAGAEGEAISPSGLASPSGREFTAGVVVRSPHAERAELAAGSRPIHVLLHTGTRDTAV